MTEAVKNAAFERGTVKKFRATLPDGPLTMSDLKTVAFFRRVMRRATLQFYRGDIDAFQFIDRMTDLIEDQFGRAWNAGARDAGFNPADMDDIDLSMLSHAIDGQADFLLNFAEAVENAALEDAPIDPLYSRIDLWANRYDETINDARMHFSQRQGDDLRLVWRLGATEQHCTTCAMLDGIVATVAQWRASGYRPQHAPNARLECGGWRCDCQLEPTDEELTSSGIPII